MKDIAKKHFILCPVIEGRPVVPVILASSYSERDVLASQIVQEQITIKLEELTDE